MIKIWHDDVRKPPDDSWMWARTNSVAKQFFKQYWPNISHIEMDHDMGLDVLDPDAYIEMDGETAHASFLAGNSEDNGFRMAVWMCANKMVPKNVVIHSWNPGGATNMAFVFNQHGYDVTIKPFEGSR